MTPPCEVVHRSATRIPVPQHVALHLQDVSEASLEACADALRTATERGADIYTLGNGGSATTASHLACDLLHRGGDGYGPRPRVRPLFDLGLSTAVANDRGYDQVFADPLRAYLREGDVVVAVSVSGRSPNVVEAMHQSRASGAVSIGLLGAADCPTAALSDVSVTVPCRDPGVVESVHLAVVHELAFRVHELLAIRV